MKRLLFSLILAIPSLTLAQNIAYEVIRTQESPGFFALRVYPGDDLPALEVETVFVENYTSKAEGKRYQTLLQNLENTGLTVLKPDEAVPLVGDERYRLVLIGGPAQTQWLQFVALPTENVSEAFDTFTQLQLGPVYLSDLTAEFGGNITEVRPAKIPFLNDAATYFVGKFTSPIRTRVSLSGETPDIVVQADGIMDLEHYTPHQAEGTLPQIWSELSPTTSQSQWSLKKLVIEMFPLFPFLIGITLLYLATRPSKYKTGMTEAINDEFWHTPIEETPLYAAWEESLPWEFTDEELRQYQINS